MQQERAVFIPHRGRHQRAGGLARGQREGCMKEAALEDYRGSFPGGEGQAGQNCRQEEQLGQDGRGGAVRCLFTEDFEWVWTGTEWVASLESEFGMAAGMGNARGKGLAFILRVSEVPPRDSGQETRSTVGGSMKQRWAGWRGRGIRPGGI